ncbi:gliding motility lipoprotein GldJ [Sphingobacterium psychroaquaticum]|uniref:Gliding motility-associated lipoprotein GldJ n=1 Tax=Sphingobacterium psychroaquaticum TaxID=561061 RepID=A0A1X7L8V3_9SPHI|nr:SUMF1/EgtB/PvdO family nonheme iron enzyme [Sphingobacterium psychroaquaticum]QBQ42346.1 gliding motility lipoprotein GldJ [Sphingobacterium psychroaquaticum]SMG49589.1 gliding motility-associated lipoprotein GldJ [Sphingobacterium psychroaquaticum]
MRFKKYFVMKKMVPLTLAICSLIALSACSKISKSGKSGDVSPKTGVAYNDPNNGGLHINRKVKETPGPGLVAVEGGTFVMGGSLNEDLGYAYDNVKRRVTVASFYIDETEVSNADWLEYLHWIAQNFPDDGKLYYDALPDSLVWRHPLSYNEPYVNLYLRHPSFQDYPVVGVSWEQATAYCQWRTDRVNENVLRKSGMLVDYKTRSEQKTTGDAFNTEIYLNGQLKGEGIDGPNMPKDNRPGAAPEAKRTVRMEDGILKQPYRLPTEAEWEYAALGLIGNTVQGNIENSRTYPWSGLGVRSDKRKNQGRMLANFKITSGNNMGVAGDLNDGGDITVPVTSYAPNDFGLYNMAGNVNEWVNDVYRQLSFEDFEDFNPFRGNVFMDNKYENAEGRVLAKDKYGRPVKVPAKAPRKQTWEELQAAKGNEDAASSYQYDARGFDDEEMKELYGKTTLINNKSRVFKGGSWNDRAYWLNPATRRFMQQDESNAMVGFRCAMTMVGNVFGPTSKAKNAPKRKSQP